jgi:hypothetical protein
MDGSGGSSDGSGAGGAGSGPGAFPGAGGPGGPGRPTKQLICVANTHIHANPELNDVKLWQVHTLLKGLEKIANRCGGGGGGGGGGGEGGGEPQGVGLA